MKKILEISEARTPRIPPRRPPDPKGHGLALLLAPAALLLGVCAIALAVSLGWISP